MIRVNVQVSSAGAKEYYTEALSRQDYYSENQEVKGLWGGKGAEKLGLNGAVDRDEFTSLCDNLLPGTGDNLTPRTKTNRRVGYDFNFHVPKSVSVMQQVVGDARILPEFRAAVAETMRELEQDMQVRVRRGGSGNRTTGNMVWAEFIHTTSRPVGGIPDCHLHAHCFAFNASFDESEGRWKAGEFGNIKRDMEYYEAAFHSRFAGRMAKLGYEIERKGKFWELGGVQPEVMAKYSRRGAQIQAEAEKRGIKSAKLKDYLGAYTRERKSAADPGIDHLEEWRSRLNGQEAAQLTAVYDAALRKTGSADGGSAAAASGVDFAIGHHFQHRSVVEERKLMASAMRHSVGRAGAAQIAENLNQRGITRVAKNDVSLITTVEAVQEEEELLAWARAGQNARKPFITRKHLFRREDLSKGQRAAVEHILESRDRLMVVRGGAGTGKTTLMKETIEAIRASGADVQCFAPTAKARDVLRQDGFPAHTVARLLGDPERQQTLKSGSVIWVDEAGMVGVRDMLAIFRLAGEKKATVILSGDERQHAAVERGDSLRILTSGGAVKPAELVEIQRQKGDYKLAVQAISEGRISDGLQLLEEMGSIREMDAAEACETIAVRYVSSLKRKKSALIISPTHREGDRVTAAVREELKKEGMIGRREWELLRQVNLNLTTAEKGDSHHYAPGMVLQFVQNAKGFTKGERVVVAEVGQGKLGCSRVAGSPASWWIDLAELKGDRFQVYRSETLKVAKGERIRITQGGSGKNGTRLENGSIHTVKSVTADGWLETSTGVKIPSHYGNLAYGYASTSVAAQGRTVDEVYIAQGRESLPASGREQLYVSASRGRERVEIYTNDKAAFFDAVNASRERLSATELTQYLKNMDNDSEEEERKKGHPAAAPDKSNAEKPKPEAGPKLEGSEATLPKRELPPEPKPSVPPLHLDPAIRESLEKNGVVMKPTPSVIRPPEELRPKPTSDSGDAYRARELSSPDEQAKRAAILELKQTGEVMRRRNETAKSVDSPALDVKPAPATPGKSDNAKSPETGKTWVEQVGKPALGAQTWVQKTQQTGQVKAPVTPPPQPSSPKPDPSKPPEPPKTPPVPPKPRGGGGAAMPPPPAPKPAPPPPKPIVVPVRRR